MPPCGPCVPCGKAKGPNNRNLRLTSVESVVGWLGENPAPFPKGAFCWWMHLCSCWFFADRRGLFSETCLRQAHCSRSAKRPLRDTKNVSEIMQLMHITSRLSRMRISPTWESRMKTIASSCEEAKFHFDLPSVEKKSYSFTYPCRKQEQQLDS
jgi:hypothetical protein